VIRRRSNCPRPSQTSGAEREGLGLLAFLTIVACGLLAAYLFAEANEAATAANRRQIQEQKESSKELSRDEATGKLLPEARLEPLPSVTEGTTELLFAEKKGSARRS
jgi:hypothetical protein